MQLLVAFPEVMALVTRDVRWTTDLEQRVSRAAGGCDERDSAAAV